MYMYVCPVYTSTCITGYVIFNIWGYFIILLFDKRYPHHLGYNYAIMTIKNI